MGFRFSQEILRLMCYTGGGISIFAFPWYFAFPLLVIGIFLGGVIENINTRIEQIKPTVEKDGK